MYSYGCFLMCSYSQMPGLFPVRLAAFAYQAKSWSSLEGGGFIWHTTGSGKTLTSFKAARLATELDFIDKVFFVVDRKDLDYQTMREYQRFSPDSVNGSDSTAGLKRNLEKDDNKIVVTTIQKLNNLMKSEGDLPIYGKQVVFIFDECHRSQFGEAQKNLQKKFKRFYQFGFTGTPIFPENALGAETTASVFGRELHSYVITDAIRDEKVLKFKVDYNDVRPQFKAIETEKDEKKLSAAENKQALLHPDRIREITQYILTNFRQKTHRLHAGNKGFNAMFASCTRVGWVMVSIGEIPRQGIMRRRMGDNALQNKPPCRMTSSKKGVRIYRNAPFCAVFFLPTFDHGSCLHCNFPCSASNH